MRTSMVLAVAACAASVVAASPADARSRYRDRIAAHRPLIVPVTPRSFLDPGKVVPVGSLSSYVYVSQYPYSEPYSFTNHYGRPPLPTEYARPQFEHLDFGPLSGP